MNNWNKNSKKHQKNTGLIKTLNLGESWCDRHNAPHYRNFGAGLPTKGGMHTSHQKGD